MDADMDALDAMLEAGVNAGVDVGIDFEMFAELDAGMDVGLDAEAYAGPHAPYAGPHAEPYAGPHDELLPVHDPRNDANRAMHPPAQVHIVHLAVVVPGELYVLMPYLRRLFMDMLNQGTLQNFEDILDNLVDFAMRAINAYGASDEIVEEDFNLARVMLELNVESHQVEVPDALKIRVREENFEHEEFWNDCLQHHGHIVTYGQGYEACAPGMTRSHYERWLLGCALDADNGPNGELRSLLADLHPNWAVGEFVP
jgi:hypothetical protein